MNSTIAGSCFVLLSCRAEYWYFVPFIDGMNDFGACLFLLDLQSPVG